MYNGNSNIWSQYTADSINRDPIKRQAFFEIQENLKLKDGSIGHYSTWKEKMLKITTHILQTVVSNKRVKFKKKKI